MMSNSLKEKVDNYLNKNFEGRYRSHVEKEENGLVISVSSEQGSERPQIGPVIDILIETVNLERFEMKADYEPAENKYIIELKGK